MRQLLSIIIIALLFACGGEKGKMIISGELKGLRNADLLIWNAQGAGSGRIDTIHITGGRFEYQSAATDQVTAWTLVYPNGSLLTIFGASGNVLKLDGNANELKRVKVTGSPDNDLYTDYRLGRLSAADLLAQHSDCAAARLVAQEQPTDSLCARVGQRLEQLHVVTADSDTIDLKRLHGHDVMIGVWASWSVDSRSMMRAMRAEKRKRRDSLEVITINVDLDENSRKTFERLDSITWHRVNSDCMFRHPLLQSLGIMAAPYIVMLDSCGVITAMGQDFNKYINKNNEPTAVQLPRRR